MSKPGISFLSRDEIEDIHNATLAILENTGVKIASKEALDILKEAGANVDYDRNHVTIPGRLVEEALRRAPKTIKFCARDPKYDFTLDKKEPHFTTSGFASCITDWESGERRLSTSEDLARWIRVVDYLENLRLSWMSVVANDVPAPMRGLIELATALRNTGKHIEPEAFDAREAQYEIEIAAAIVGGKEELRKRPIISAIQSPISPLSYDKGSMEASIEFARAGIPVVSLTMPLAGETSPVTLLGTVVITNAENLGNLVILQFASPGAPVIYGAASTVANPRTGACMIGAPERSVIHMTLAELTRYYQLPCMLAGGNSDSKTPDMQAGFEKAMTLTTLLLARGVDIVDGLGAIDSANTMCAEALVIDNEIAGAVTRACRGLEVNNDNLAVDVIHEVGPGGIFLGQKHTLKHYKKEIWLPEISDKNTYATWQKMGSRSMDKVAKERVRAILATHKPKPIPEDVDKEISRIVQRAEAEVLRKS
jgi:trimethylamine--corrinoid protein Co-methyltransferase